MFNFKKTLILTAAAWFTLISPALVLAATPAQNIQQGACDAAGTTDCANASAQATTSLNDTIHSVINILSVIVGVVAVIMIIIAGFRYVTSAGDTAKVTSAKNTLIYAIIGLVIVALAQVIARFTLHTVTSSSSSSSQNSGSSGGNPEQLIH